MPDSIRAYREDRRLNQRGGVTVTTNHWLDSPVTLESRADDDPSTYAEYIRADLMGWVPVSERLPEDGDGSGMHDEITLGDIDGNRIMIPVAVFLVERSAAPEEWDQYTHWFSMGEVPE